ncbi:unnamed protein product [Coffea canephora]|uniref:Uncharacterized protein n=1 Tax=Coffea canephora TaxID=49390 RepID=A0A068TPA6_COFCA|nr:unnamed protein product [Coffea canephora]
MVYPLPCHQPWPTITPAIIHLLPRDSFQVSLGLKILSGSSLLFSSGCLFSSGLACGMGEILEDQRMDLDLEDDILFYPEPMQVLVISCFKF